ncbi:efflux RND transporter periplasmic adaptor subunit [Limnobacter sp.]|uniref:efflux RND transporter periplasmic adaptor subunit n=1 Tax=Limnobacter sp. TaxID=2003368 RepID=UPI003511968E
MTPRVILPALLGALLVLSACSQASNPQTANPAEQAGQPSLTVELFTVQNQTMPVGITVNGSVAAWQEALIGAQLAGVRIEKLLAQAGDVVKKGQLLAQYDQATVQADLQQALGALAEAQALYEQARINAELVAGLGDSGAISRQERLQVETISKSAMARLQSAKAAVAQQQIRMANTRVVAIDDGVISARRATLGAVPNPGEELFRLVRQQRLEWRAELSADELLKVKVGMPVVVQHGEQTLQGKVRTLGAAVDPQSRMGLVYVDLPGAYAQGMRPGMFVQGRFELAQQPALVVPQSAVVERDGFTYVFVVPQGASQVQRVKVQADRTGGQWVRILEGLQAGQAVVKTGVAFLADGDVVKVLP